MIIKKYVANTVEEAQELIRQELGSKATILTSRYVKQKGLRALFAADKVEVTAAVEQRDLQSYTDDKLEQGEELKGKELEASMNRLKQLLASAGKEAEKKAPVKQQAPTMVMSGGGSPTYGDPRFTRRSRPTAPTAVASHTPEPIAPTAPSSDVDTDLARRKLEALRKASKPRASSNQGVNQLTQGLVDTFGAEDVSADQPQDDIRAIIREELARAKSATKLAATQAPIASDSETLRFLVGKGIDHGIAQEIDSQLRREFGSVNLSAASKKRVALMNGLKQELSARIKTSGPLILTPGVCKVVAIVGPTGVGKSTTLVKIAAEQTQKWGKKVAIVTLDTAKSGASEQMRGLAAPLGIPVATTGTVEELIEALSAFSSYDLCLVDTSGRSQYLMQSIDLLGKTLAAINNCDVMLAVSATTKDIDVYGTVEHFSSLGINSVIVTKLDETIAQGILVNICQKTGMAISYITNGQQIDGTMTTAEPESIARAILVQNNRSEYQRFRKMAGG